MLAALYITNCGMYIENFITSYLIYSVTNSSDEHITQTTQRDVIDNVGNF